MSSAARRLVTRVLFVHDLAGYTKATAVTPPLALADFLDAYYGACAARVHAGGGRIVKFMGDACLAIFDPSRAVDALAAAVAVRDDVAPLAAAHGVAVSPGKTCVHLAQIAEGELGPEGDRHFDVIGQGVNVTFLLGTGRGAGVHVSEALVGSLPAEHAAAWAKHVVPLTTRT
jgi:adenylate cyclase